jgi:hypothetical protein
LAGIKEDHVRVRRFVFVLLAFAAAFAMPAATAGAASPTKPYRVTLSPESVSAGVTIDAFTITLTNETGTQQLGSSNVDVPGDLTIIGDPTLDAPAVARGATVSLDPNRRNRLLLRNLNLPPNASVTVTLGLRMTCVASSPTNTYTWSFETKQSNDFNGPPGNALGPILGSLTTEVTGHCALRFVAQPGDARKDDQIRADDFGGLESSNYVSVEAIDGSADPQRLDWFAGPVSIRLVQTSGRLSPSPALGDVAAGLASFRDVAINVSGIYNLRPTTSAPGFTPTNPDDYDSADFQIIEVTEPCNPGQCRAQLSGRQTTSTVEGAVGTDTGLLLLSLNLGPDPVCAGYSPPTAEWYDFRLFSATAPDFTGDLTVFATYSKAAMKTVAGPSSLEICFASPNSFITKSGLAAQPFDYDGDPDTPAPGSDGKEGFVGLLPNCPQANNPCVDKRGGLNGGAIVTFLVPSFWSDPRYH